MTWNDFPICELWYVETQLFEFELNWTELNACYFFQIIKTPLGLPKRGKQAIKRNGNETILSDLGKLTECSRLLAHSTEDLISRFPENDEKFDTDTSMTSSRQTPNYDDDDDHLDLSDFHKTQDFGDFQIMTDSPKKAVVPQPASKRSANSRSHKLKF